MDAAHGPRVHARVLTPDERKMKHVHLSVVARLDVTEDLVERLVKYSRVLLVAPTKREAKETYEKMKQWTSDQVHVSLFIEGGFTVNEHGHNLTITYARSSLVRGANMGHYNTVIVHSNVQGAMLHELGLGFINIRAAIEEGRQTNMVQPAGRITRPNEIKTKTGFFVEELGDDFLTKHVILITQEDPATGLLLDTGYWFRDKFSELSLVTSMTTFQVYPKRVADAHEELFTTGEVLTTDAVAPGVTAAQLSPRQRRLTTEERETAKKVMRQARIQAKLDALAVQTGKPVPWHEAKQRVHLERCGLSSEEIARLRVRYYGLQ